MGVTFASFRVSCHGGYGCGSKASQLGGTPGCFPSLTVGTVISAAMKSSHQRGGFEVSFSLNPPNPVFKVHGIIGNRELSLVSRGNQGGNSINLY